MKFALSSLAVATLTIGAATAANAELYYGLGYTHNFESEGLKNSFDEVEIRSTEYLDGRGVYDSHSFNFETGKGVTATVGFPVKNNFAIEARYTYIADAIDSKLEINSTQPVYNEETGGIDIYDVKETFDFNADAHKFGVHGVYRHSLNEYVYAKGGVGITHTMYEQGGKYTQYLNNEVQNVEINMKPKKFKEARTELEASLGIGVRLSSCCNLELEYNSSAHNDSATASVVWRF